MSDTPETPDRADRGPTPGHPWGRDKPPPGRVAVPLTAIQELRVALWDEDRAAPMAESDLARAVREFLDLVDGRGPR